MRKKNLFLAIVTVLGLFMCVPQVKADYIVGYPKGRRDENAVVSDPSVPSVRNYTANIDGTDSMVYCLDPGRTYGGDRNGINTYVFYRAIDPSTSTGEEFVFDVAATFIYQRILDMNTGNSNANRVVGTTAYRLLVRNTGVDRGLGANLEEEYNAYAPNGAVWNSGDSNVRLGVQFYREAIEIARSGKSYQQLVEEGTLWGPQFKYELVKTTNTGNQTIYTYRITSTANKPEKFSEYASGIQVTCANSSVKCSMNVGTTTSTSMDINVVVDTSSWNKQSLGLIINLPYCDIKSSTFNLVILQDKDEPYHQQMLVAFPSTHKCPASPNLTYIPRHQIIIEDGKEDSCVCHYDDDGTWDGYVITENKWNVKSEWTSFTGWSSWGSKYQGSKFVDKNTTLLPEDQEHFNCPTCSPKGHTCEKSSESPTGYFCRESAPGKGDGQACPKETFETSPSINSQGCGDSICKKEGNTYYCADGLECPKDTFDKDPSVDPRGCGGKISNGHSCEKSSESRTGYFCRESAPGKGDGEECSLEKYLSNDPDGCGDKIRSCEKVGSTLYCRDGSNCTNDPDRFNSECLCGPLEDKCKNNPNDPDCDEYYDKCINCNPTVTIPSDCSDFDEPFDDGNSGGITDIPKSPNSCNNNQANMVKSCVIGKKDAGGKGESFQDTTIAENDYCKVWCEEEYDFGLPAAQRTQSGRYFTLTTWVSGTRTCYTSAADDTSEPIDEEKFRNDLDAARKAVIDAYNEYTKWNEAANHAVETKDETKHEEGDSTCCDTTLIDTDGDGVKDACDKTTGCTGSHSTTDLIYKYSWSWTKVEYSGDTTPQNGSYTSGTAGSCVSCCSSSSSPCTDGTDGTQQHDTFVTNASNALTTFNQKVQELKNIIAMYNSCSGDLNDSTNGITSNAWSNEFNFNPEITFSYHESYNSSLDNNGKFVPSGEQKESSTKVSYCSGDTDRSYECINGTSASANNNTLPDSMKGSISIYTCESQNGSLSCGTKTYAISTAKWVKKTETVDHQEYSPNNNFSTYTPYGTIAKNVDTNTYTLYTTLPDNAFPISLITKAGVFPFNIKFNNIGQSNSDHTNGRLIGENYKVKDILTAFNNLGANKCNRNGQKDPSYQSATTASGYVCHYVNNCPDCEPRCENPEGCEVPDDDICPDCPPDCPDCIYNGTQSNYSFRTVSLNRLFPNDRTPGYNWNSNRKAQLTKDAIQNDGENIYKKAQYSYTLTPQSMSKIREYNDLAGSYTNAYIPDNSSYTYRGLESIYCQKDPSTGYNINCKSRFLDMLDEFENTVKSLASNITRVTRDDNAWESFTNCTSGYGVGDCVNVGPSWRLRSVE